MVAVMHCRHFQLSVRLYLTNDWMLRTNTSFFLLFHAQSVFPAQTNPRRSHFSLFSSLFFLHIANSIFISMVFFFTFVMKKEVYTSWSFKSAPLLFCASLILSRKIKRIEATSLKIVSCEWDVRGTKWASRYFRSTSAQLYRNFFVASSDRPIYRCPRLFLSYF